MIYIGEKNARFASLISASPDIDETYTIYAGKFRRYHGQSLLAHLLDVKTNLLNARDVIYTAVGLWQSLWLVRRLRADAMLCKGGFVCVPVGLSAAVWRLPFVTHDSDSIPGLANRIIGRYATAHATGMPIDLYRYPPAKMTYTGIPLAADYKLVDAHAQAEARLKLNIPAQAIVVLVTGGSNGAQRLNKPVADMAFGLLEDYPNLWLIHQVGPGNGAVYSQKHSRLIVSEYFEGMHNYSAAADVVIARAGATTIAELAIQAKPVILVPSPYLTGGHQVINARYLAGKNMACLVEESNLAAGLKPALIGLLDNPTQRHKLASQIHKAARPSASYAIAKLLTEAAQTKVKR